MSVALQPVPPELSRVVTIQCNDCETVQSGRGWHFLGVQCRDCESFNTVVERITMTGPTAHRFLLQNDDGGRELAATRVPRAQGTEAGSVGVDAAEPAARGNGRSQGTHSSRRRRASMATVPSSRPAPPSGIDPPPFG